MNNTVETITEIIRRCLPKTTDELSTDSNIFSLGIDSISILNVIVDLETELNLSFDDDELETKNFTTIDNIYELLKKKGYA